MDCTEVDSNTHKLVFKLWFKAIRFLKWFVSP